MSQLAISRVAVTILLLLMLTEAYMNNVTNLSMYALMLVMYSVMLLLVKYIYGNEEN